jgi:8-oxo-dGTP pyrophosphatase MutT (NUDIX family)
MKGDITKVIREIENFSPLCPQEKKDKQLILSALKKDGDIVLTRESELFHLTASGFTVNEDRTETLMVFHNIYNSWSWIGGHTDGDGDLLGVAIKEAKEETGIEHIKPDTGKIFSIDILTTKGHWKNGSYVAPHLHFNITYLLIGDKKDAIRKKEDENKAVGWILLDEVINKISEPDMIPTYEKLLDRIRKNENNSHG